MFYVITTAVTSYTVTDKIDFEKDCKVQLNVYDTTVAEVFAYPQANVIPEISSCQAKFVASPSDRKLKIYIHEFTLGGGACGHKINIYDGDPYMKDPKWELGCNINFPRFIVSATNEIIISFVKPSVDTSQLYSFNIKITTDQDEAKLYFKPREMPALYRILHHRERRESANIPSYTAPLTGSVGGGGGGLTSGAIAGIAVGAVVGAVIIIAICIYALWRFMRKSEEKRRYGHTEPPPVFVTNNSSNVNGILKYPSSTGSTRSKTTNKSRGGIDNDAFSNMSETTTNDFRYDKVGSYSRRSGERYKNDYGHQNEAFSNDADEEKGHISLADLSQRGGRTANGDYPLARRNYGDESKTESSFNTGTETRTYSESSSRDGSNSVSMNPGGHYKKHERAGSIRKNRSRSQSMTSNKSSDHSGRPRSNSADRSEKDSQARSHQSSSSHRSHQSHSHSHSHGHGHSHGHRSHNSSHRDSSRSSRRKKQRPPDPYLPIYNEAMTSAKNKKKQHY